MRRFLRSGSAALALALALSGSAQAGTIREPASPSRASLVESFQEWLRSLAPQLSSLSVLWEEAGSIMDPNGQPTGSSLGPGSDEGGIMDPNG